MESERKGGETDGKGLKGRDRERRGKGKDVESEGKGRETDGKGGGGPGRARKGWGERKEGRESKR